MEITWFDFDSCETRTDNWRELDRNERYGCTMSSIAVALIAEAL